MNSLLRIPLNATPDQVERLHALQVGFAKVCNAIAPVVQQTKVWNRVALHHLTYRQLREQFPEMGSQMVCNAIYSVSRTGRLVYQHPASPFNLARLGDKPLPLLQFADTLPVYFDRHTLSVKAGQLSMFTLDGRMRFELALRPEDEASFHEKSCARSCCRAAPTVCTCCPSYWVMGLKARKLNRTCLMAKSRIHHGSRDCMKPNVPLLNCARQ